MVVIEVSKSQARIADFHDTMQLNRYKTLIGKNIDWHIVDTAVTDDEARKKVSFWDNVMKQRTDTNADHIRAMSDAELATWLFSVEQLGKRWDDSRESWYDWLSSTSLSTGGDGDD